MPAVLVALGGNLNSDLLLLDVDRLNGAGLDVRLVTWAPPSPELAASVDEVVVLYPAAAAVMARDPSSERAAQEVLEQAEDSLSAGDMPGAERIEESLGTDDAEDDLEDEAEDDSQDDEPAAPPLPRVKATGVARVVEVAERAVRNPRPYVARVYTLGKRRTRPVRRRLRRDVRRRVRAFRSNLHQPRATAAFFRDDRVRRVTAGCDVFVAIDSVSIFAVWTLARRHEGALAVVGVDAALARRPGVDTTA